jgi:hypothetical protein
MSRRVAVVAVRTGPWVRVKIAPGFARSLEEADALADALLVPRRVRREVAKNAATREAQVMP